MRVIATVIVPSLLLLACGQAATGKGVRDAKPSAALIAALDEEEERPKPAALPLASLDSLGKRLAALDAPLGELAASAWVPRPQSARLLERATSLKQGLRAARELAAEGGEAGELAERAARRIRQGLEPLEGEVRGLHRELAGAPPATLAALLPTLPPEGPARAEALGKFADDERLPIGERLHAADARLALEKTPAGRVEALIMKARLAGVASKPKLRARALRRAAAAASKAKLPRREKQLEFIMESERHVPRADRLAARPRKKASPAQTQAMEAIKAALPALEAVGDAPGRARALLAKAVLTGAVEGGEAQALAQLEKVAALPGGRDLAPIRVGAHAWRIRLFERLERRAEVLEARLAMDRARAPHPDAPNLLPPRQPLHLRSRETEEACVAARTEGHACAEIERRVWGKRTYYDYSAEPVRAEFDTGRAGQVLEAYRASLQACVSREAHAGRLAHHAVELEWTVENDGRVRVFDLRPTEHRGSVLESCMQAAFALFRYPPYEGELFHVSLRFDVRGTAGR